MKLGKTATEIERDDLAIGLLHVNDPELAIAAKQFGCEMLAKLGRKSRQGRHGWSEEDDDWNIDEIKRRLVEHVAKGDPVDVANYALFWWAMEIRLKQPSVEDRPR